MLIKAFNEKNEVIRSTVFSPHCFALQHCIQFTLFFFINKLLWLVDDFT